MKVWDRLVSFRRDHETYAAYGIGCAIVWVLIWAGLAVGATQQTRERMKLVSGAWWMGWLSATIARAAYPPPKKRLFKRDAAVPSE